MKIFITGGAGFVGTNLLQHILSIDPTTEVKLLDNLSTGRYENIAPFLRYENVEFIEGNAKDRTTLEPLIAWCDHCYHLAAPVGVKLVMEKPVLTVLDNIRMIDLVMELVSQYKKRILISSSSEIYGKSLDLLDPTGEGFLKESDYRVEGSTKNHRWAYANTKALSEFLAFAYHKENGTEVVIARFFNMVGPYQAFDFGMVLPNFVHKALQNEDISIFGDGLQKRSFMHVQDAVRAIYELMVTGKGIGEEYNIGNPIEITMNQLAERVIALTQSKSKIVHISYEIAYGKGFEDMNRRAANIEKIQATIGFELHYDLDKIIQEVIAYYRPSAPPL
ncbi:MAG: NAD-dependent epimerase/dehydratase family protein [Bacteroidia bacterium]